MVIVHIKWSLLLFPSSMPLMSSRVSDSRGQFSYTFTRTRTLLVLLLRPRIPLPSCTIDKIVIHGMP